MTAMIALFSYLNNQFSFQALSGRGRVPRLPGFTHPEKFS